MPAGRFYLPSLYIEAAPLDKHSQAAPGNEETENFILILARIPPSPLVGEGPEGRGLRAR